MASSDMSGLRLRTVCATVLLNWVLMLGPPAVHAASNAAIGGINGINNGTLSGGDGTGTAQITLNAVDLALVKQARDLSGVVLPNGSNVTTGQVIYFVLYVDNTTNFPASDIRITDLLNEAEFTYVANSIETTLVPTGSSDAAIWAGAWTPLTDAVGAPDDTASITDTGGPPDRDRLTVGSVPAQANQTLTIPATSLRAIRFRVTVN